LPWTLVLVAVVGALVGTRFRAPALIAATAVAFLTGIVYGLASGTTLLGALLRGLALIAALQVGYLAGAAGATLWRDGRRR